MSIVWRDKVLSSYNGNIESVMVYNSADEKAEVPNGTFVTLEGLEGTGREVKKAVLTSGAVDALLIASPEVIYDGRGDQLEDFVNEAGVVARAFRLADGDVITFTEDLIDEAIAVGDTFVTGAEGRLVKASTLPDAPASPLTFVVREDAGFELTRSQKAWRFDIVK